MTDWITDRLPTKADADKDGDVLVPGKPGDPFNADTIDSWNYRLIILGQPWLPAYSKASSAPADPAPAQAQPAPKPEYSDPMEQARLEHLRAQMMSRILDPNASSNDAVPVNLPEAQ